MIDKTVGHYRITAKLGAGGMGEVFLAEDTRLERQAAIKFLPAEMATDPQRRQRFFKEAKAASALNHPHVCIVYDVGETDDGLPCNCCGNTVSWRSSAPRAVASRRWCGPA